MAKQPTKIYAIHAYSKLLNVTKRIFDEDSLRAPYQHTTLAYYQSSWVSQKQRRNATRFQQIRRYKIKINIKIKKQLNVSQITFF